VSTTVSPSAARRRAITTPIPDVAPVTIATRVVDSVTCTASFLCGRGAFPPRLSVLLYPTDEPLTPSRPERVVVAGNDVAAQRTARGLAERRRRDEPDGAGAHEVPARDQSAPGRVDQRLIDTAAVPPKSAVEMS